MIHNSYIVQHTGNARVLVTKSDLVYLQCLLVGFLSILEMVILLMMTTDYVLLLCRYLMSERAKTKGTSYVIQINTYQYIRK